MRVSKIKTKMQSAGMLGGYQESSAIKKAKEMIYVLCQDVVPERPIVYNSKNIDRGPIPMCLMALVKEVTNDFDPKEIQSYQISCFVGYKTTNTIIPRPSNTVISRVIYNIGNSEIYHFGSGGSGLKDLDDLINKKAKSQTEISIEKTNHYLAADTYVSLGYCDMCDFEIEVKENPPRKRPMIMDRNGKKKELPFLRPESYHRITVVIDLNGSTDVAKNMSEIIHETINDMKIPNKSQLMNMLSDKGVVKEKDDPVDIESMM